MLKKLLGKTGIEIAEVGLGTWQYRGGLEPLRLGISLGSTFIDTAEAYGTEGIVGRAIEGIPREELFIATKVSPHHFHYEDVLRSAADSLKRLNIKNIDLYQLHWPNSSIPIKETMQAMEQLANEGKIRYIGVSNFSVQEMKDAQECLSRHELVSNQVRYNLNDREIERDVLPYCRREKITVIAYSPLTRGQILGKRTGHVDRLDQLAEKYGKTRSQVVLNWLLADEAVMVIPKSDKQSHIKENCGASDWRLGKDDYQLIAENFH